MSEEVKHSNHLKDITESNEPTDTFQPDIYYFLVQVASELDDIQNNVLGKVLTLIDAIGLDTKQEKAIKDLIRTVMKEQMIKSRRLLDERLETVFKLGMLPIDKTTVPMNRFAFTHSYAVTPVYEEKDMMGDGSPRGLLV